MTRHSTKTDDELAALDITVLLRFGLPTEGAMRTSLFGDGAIGAAVTLDRLGVVPRAVAFLARIVRSGGLSYAADLEAPFPVEEASRTVREWLAAAQTVARDVTDEDTVARWLEAVAAIMAMRWDNRHGDGAGRQQGDATGWN